MRDRRRDALRAAARLTAASVLLPVVGLGRTSRLLTVWGGRRARAADHGRAADLAATVESVARRLPLQPACLARSVALWSMLRREGIGADVEVGVRKVGEGIGAHAWVRTAAGVFGDAESAEFARLERPAAGGASTTGG